MSQVGTKKVEVVYKYSLVCQGQFLAQGEVPREGVFLPFSELELSVFPLFWVLMMMMMVMVCDYSKVKNNDEIFV